MSELRFPDGVTIAQVRQALVEAFELDEGVERDVERTFYDTFDGLLYEAGLSAVHHDGRLALVERESGRERAALATAAPSAPLLAVELAPGALRNALTPIVDVRALLALATVRSRDLALDVLDDERKTVARMTLVQPSLVAPAPAVAPLDPRLQLTGVRGYDRELEHVRQALVTVLGYTVADRPLVDEAVTAAGEAPGGTSLKLEVALDYDERADAAAAAVLLALLAVIEGNLDGTIADTDSEFLHDLRVAVRRSRSVQRQLQGVFPPYELARFRGEFRWLQQVTGDVRDLDVYVLEFDDYRAMVPAGLRPELGPLLAVLHNRRAVARREMVAALRSERAATLRSRWAALLSQLSALPADGRPDATRTIGELSGERIRKVYRKMVRMGRGIDDSSPPEEYHELRKSGKELRYLLELFGNPLYSSGVVRPMIKTLKALQDVLGRHQDREVQVATMYALRDEVAGLPGGAGALMGMGVLVERLGDDEQAARAEFAARFEEFASPEQRHLVKTTFK